VNSSDTRVQTYLDDLARMLSDLDPGERDDVLAGIREHLDATLDEHPDDPGAVDAALLRLGPPERVAAEARADQPSRTREARAGDITSALPHRRWLLAAILLTLVTTVPFTLATVLDRALALVNNDSVSWPAAVALFPGVVTMFLTWPLWVAGVACTVVARRLAPRSWGMLLACGPICFAATAIATFWREPDVVSALVSVALLLCATGLTAATARTAWREPTPTRNHELGAQVVAPAAT